MRMQGSSKKEAQALEVEVNHIFRKKTTAYFSNDGEIQKKVCDFIINVKNQDGQWLKFSEEFDFSQYIKKDSRDKEHKVEIKFKNKAQTNDFKDAFILAKIQVVEYNKNDVDQKVWVQEAENAMLQTQKTTKSVSGVPSINILQTQILDDEEVQEEVSLQKVEGTAEMFKKENMRVTFDVKTLKIISSATS